MPRRSRRALLELLGSGTAALLAGCQADPSTDATERSSPTDTSTAATTATASDTPSDTATDAVSETPESTDCATVSRPELAWPVSRRSPARDGFVAAPAGFEDAPSFAWEAESSVPEDSYASARYGRPVVGDGRVYLVNLLDKGPQVPLYGHVHALDAGRGDRQWTSERLRSPSAPVIWNDLAVVVTEDEPHESLVIAFDRADGTRRWTRGFETLETGFVAADDHLYLAMEEASDRGTVQALAADGSTVWQRVGAFADHVNVAPVVGPDTIYVTTREGRLHALSRDDGTTAWTYKFQHPTEQRPFVTDLVATDCAVLAVVEGAVVALDDSGTRAWQVDGDHGPLATDGEVVYVGAILGGGEHELRVLDAATGEVRSSVGGPLQTYSPQVVTDTRVYVNFDEGTAALDRSDGTERWRTDRSMDDLALANGTLYGTTGKTLLALR